MFIPTWVLIIAIIVAFFYLKNKKGKNNSEEDNISPEGNWQGAERYKELVLEKSPLLEGFLEDEKDMVKSMEMDMIILRERYKYDKAKQAEVAQDWYDFAKAVYNVKSSSERLDVDMEDNAFDNFLERTKEPHAIIQEVIKRVENLLGEESNIKKVHERLESKKPKGLDEIVKEVAEKKEDKPAS